MPALVDIVIADAQGTPENHTFKPMGLDKNGVLWAVDQSRSNAVGYWRISFEQKQPAPPRPGESSQDRTYRLKIGLHMPVLETNGDSSASGILPAPTVAYIPRSFHEYIIPERSALRDRQDMAKMASLLLSNAQIKNMIETLAVYS